MSGTSAFSSPSAPVILEKTALVTGATDGIGLTTAKNLAKKGYRVIVHGRNPDRVKKACQIVRDAGNGFAAAVPAMADLSNLSGCRQLVAATTTACLAKSTQLDLIVNNAGVYAPEKKLVGEFDLEETFAVNVLAPFVVTSMLLPLLTAKDGSRIIFVSSISQCNSIDWDNVMRWDKKSYYAHTSYSESKLLDAMLSNEFAERLAPLGTKRVTVNTLDPGTVNTKMLLEGWGPCGISVDDALDQTWLGTSDDVEGVTGKYFVGRRDSRAGKAAYDAKERKKLWDMLIKFAPEEVEKTWDQVLGGIDQSN